MDEIAALIEPQIPALRRYAVALLRDREAADDLVQDTLERALSAWSGRRRDGDLRAWLFTIERNLFLGTVRRRGRRGIDVGAKAEIYQLMRRFTAQGYAIIMISSELPEVIGMADRVCVFRSGGIVATVEGDAITSEGIMTHATTGKVHHVA